MEDVSFCSIIGIAGMLLALVIAAAKLFVLRVDDYAPTHWLRKCAHHDSRQQHHEAARCFDNMKRMVRCRLCRSGHDVKSVLCCMCLC